MAISESTIRQSERIYLQVMAGWAWTGCRHKTVRQGLGYAGSECKHNGLSAATSF